MKRVISLISCLIFGLLIKFLNALTQLLLLQDTELVRSLSILTVWRWKWQHLRFSLSNPNFTCSNTCNM